MKALAKFSNIIEIFKKMGFKVSKDLKNPTIMIKTNRAIVKYHEDKPPTTHQFKIKAEHHCTAQNYFATIALMDLFEEDKSFLLVANPENFGGYKGNLTPDLWLEVLENNR